MKYVLWTVVGLVVLGVVVVGAGYYMLTGYKVDFKDPQVVDGFRSSFVSSCSQNFQRELAKKNMTTGPVLASKIEQVCTCTRDGVIEVLAKREAMTATELATAMGNDPEIVVITKACTVQFGITDPQ